MNIQEKTLRVITFQSREVIRLIESLGKYKASHLLKRTPGRYEVETDLLYGDHPIWGFVVPSDYKVCDMFTRQIFEDFLVQMNLSYNRISDFVCLELYLPESEVVDYGFYQPQENTVIFKSIDKKQLGRIYHLDYTNGKCSKLKSFTSVLRQHKPQPVPEQELYAPQEAM